MIHQPEILDLDGLRLEHSADLLGNCRVCRDVISVPGRIPASSPAKSPCIVLRLLSLVSVWPPRAAMAQRLVNVVRHVLRSGHLGQDDQLSLALEDAAVRLDAELQRDPPPEELRPSTDQEWPDLATAQRMLEDILALGPSPRPWSDFCESGDWWVESCDPDGSPAGDFVMGANNIRGANLAYIIWAANLAPGLLALATAQDKALSTAACAWCGWESPSPLAEEDAERHLLACAKHPLSRRLRELQAERDNLAYIVEQFNLQAEDAPDDESAPDRRIEP